jgi:hypothetical protein
MTLPTSCERVDMVADTAAVASAAPPLVQQGALGTPEVPTVGSVEHAIGNCRPCAFFYKQGCENGVQCKFCHICGPGEKRRRQKEKKAMFRQHEQVDHRTDELLSEPLGMEASGPAPPPLEPVLRDVRGSFIHQYVDTNMPVQQLECQLHFSNDFSNRRLVKPPALNLDDGLDVPMPLTSPQSWPETPSECWPPTPADNVASSDIGAQVLFEPWKLNATMFSTSIMAPSMEEAYWSWQALMPPPLPASLDMSVMLDSSAPPSDLLTVPTRASSEAPLAPTSCSVLRLAETILEPELGSVECPTVGSMNHRFGTCKPCAFLHKQGCSNGVDCAFCHLCDAGEKKRRQMLKKEQLKRITENSVLVDAV